MAGRTYAEGDFAVSLSLCLRHVRSYFVQPSSLQATQTEWVFSFLPERDILFRLAAEAWLLTVPEAELGQLRASNFQSLSIS
jgi:hypothetical protein